MKGILPNLNNDSRDEYNDLDCKWSLNGDGPFTYDTLDDLISDYNLSVGKVVYYCTYDTLPCHRLVDMDSIKRVLIESANREGADSLISTVLSDPKMAQDLHATIADWIEDNCEVDLYKIRDVYEHPIRLPDILHIKDHYSL